MLCKPEPEWRPLLAELGVKRLTGMASIDLEYVDGIEQAEEQIRTRCWREAMYLLECSMISLSKYEDDWYPCYRIY